MPPATTLGAPRNAAYLTTQAEAGLTAEVNLGALTTGYLYATVAGGVATISTGNPSATPGGADTQLQYNDGGAFGGLSALTWDDSNFMLGSGAATKLQFRDSALYISSKNDGYLDIDADTAVRVNTGSLGVNVPAPGRKLDVLDASNPQLRLTHTDGSVYADLQTDANGYLTVTPSGSRVGIFAAPETSIYAALDTSLTTRLSQATDDANGPVLQLRKGRGTHGSLVDCNSGDTLGSIQCQQRRSGAWYDGSRIRFAKIGGSYGSELYVDIRWPGSGAFFTGLHVDDECRVGLGGAAASNAIATIYGPTNQYQPASSNPSWGVDGVQLRGQSGQYGDSSAAGTRPTAVSWSIGRPTFAATNAGTIITDAVTFYVANAPVAGTNMTLTNPWAVWVAAGACRFDGAMQFGTYSGLAGETVQGFITITDSGGTPRKLAVVA